MACSAMRLAFVLLLAFSAAVAESRVPFRGSTDPYACMLKKESLPLASKGAGSTAGNEKLCRLCQQYSMEALVYLQQNETKAEILSVLNHECAKLGPLRQQFCESAHLCPKKAPIRESIRGEACGLCHQALVEALTMLKDPNAKVEIIQLLLKTCTKAEKYVAQCQRLVREYVPLILVKTQKYLETTDVCFQIHACKTDAEATMETILLSAAL